MKIFLVLALLLFGQEIGQRSFAPPSSGCSVQADQQTGTNNQSGPLGDQSSNTYGAFSFTAASSYTLCAITVPLEKVGTPSYTLTAYVYSNSSNSPASLIGTGSAGIATTSLGTSYANITFTGLSAAITASTQYWVVIKSTSAPNDNTNYAQWGGTGSGCTPYFAISPTGSSWSTGDACVTGILTTYHS